MAYLSYPAVRVAGVSACVPQQIESNWTSPLIPDAEREKLITTTGIEENIPLKWNSKVKVERYG